MSVVHSAEFPASLGFRVILWQFLRVISNYCSWETCTNINCINRKVHHSDTDDIDNRAYVGRPYTTVHV